MFGLLSGITAGLKALTGFSDAISNVSKAIADSKIAAINAKTKEEQIAAEERTKALEARRDLLVAEAQAGSRANIWIRTGMALPVAILLWKVFVYDKVLGQWTHARTDGLDENLWHVVWIVLGFYFLYEITRAVKR